MWGCGVCFQGEKTSMENWETQSDEQEQHTIKILSIDGGGVRGLIPATVLRYLEDELQKLDGPDARIADYFDLITGTSTGSLITTLLTTPNENNRPLLSANEIVDFYYKNMPAIFNKNWLSTLKQLLWGPKYDGKALTDIVRKTVGDTTIRETVTNVLIPTFDIKLLNPTIFTTNAAKNDVSKNVKIADACLSSFAAPTFFPPRYFETRDSNGNVREFHLIDGGVAANNPTRLGVNHVLETFLNPDQDIYPQLPEDKKGLSTMEKISSSKFVIISVGTGKVKHIAYSAKEASKWSILNGWFFNRKGTNPLIDFFLEASSDITDYNIEVLFQVLQKRLSYLRIQTDTLIGDIYLKDNATLENMRRLEETGRELLEKPIMDTNMETGELQVVRGAGVGTNREALTQVARLLSAERRKSKTNKT